MIAGRKSQMNKSSVTSKEDKNRVTRKGKTRIRYVLALIICIAQLTSLRIATSPVHPAAETVGSTCTSDPPSRRPGACRTGLVEAKPRQEQLEEISSKESKQRKPFALQTKSTNTIRNVLTIGYRWSQTRNDINKKIVFLKVKTGSLFFHRALCITYSLAFLPSRQWLLVVIQALSPFLVKRVLK